MAQVGFRQLFRRSAELSGEGFWAPRDPPGALLEVSEASGWYFFVRFMSSAWWAARLGFRREPRTVSGDLELLLSHEITGPRFRCRSPMVAWVRFKHFFPFVIRFLESADTVILRGPIAGLYRRRAQP